MNPVISVKKLGKSFDGGGTAFERFIRATIPLKFANKPGSEVLVDISLDVNKGEIVGIIGANGAGKSTLLRIIFGTLKPSSGEVRTVGKVSALLELGAGFSPELSGRENVLLYCLMHGFSLEESKEKIFEIEKFADLGQYFDRNIKIYSSGMFVRLAFSAAINTNPDILIVDEALAVGDAKFVHKCFRKLEEFKRANKTLVIVSHDENTILNQCQRAVLLHEGQVWFDGEPKEAIKRYNEILFGAYEDQTKDALSTKINADNEKRSASEDELVRFLNSVDNFDHVLSSSFYNKYENRRRTKDASIFDVLLRRRNSALKNSDEIMSGDTLNLSFKVQAQVDVLVPVYGFELHSASGIRLYATNNIILDKPIEKLRAGDQAVASFEFMLPVRSGDYFLTLGFAEKATGEDALLDYREAVLHLTVFDKRTFDGTLNLQATFRCG